MSEARKHVRWLAKRCALGVTMLLVSPIAALVSVEGWLFGSQNIFYGGGCMMSLVPGIIGNYIRLGYYRLTLRSCSPDALIGFGSFFTKRTAQLGRYAGMGAYCIVGSVTLEEGTLLGSRVSVPSGKHQHSARYSESQDSVTLHFDHITIGKRCWIGEGSIVLADVGAGSIVSAGAVVTRAVPSDCLVAGNPARLLKRLDATPT